MAKVSFFTKDKTICPVCGAEFKKESLFSGGGRLNAGELTDELRRLYIPTKKYGKIIPLIYPVSVCPKCYFAFYAQDIDVITKTGIEQVQSETNRRIQLVKQIFPKLNFNDNRGIEEGIASYILALYSYAFFPALAAPSFKKGNSALRAAWLVGDYIEENPDKKEIYELRDVMYRRAYYFYDKAYHALEKGKEHVDKIKNFGPDMDKNFGFDGFLYLYSYLFYHYGLPFIDDIEEKKKKVSHFKIVLSKVFGIGKSSKDKTVFLLENARSLYDRFSEIFAELNDGEDNTLDIADNFTTVDDDDENEDDDLDLSDIDLSDIDL